MKKLIFAILSILFPAIALAADGSLSFAPPASDFSVVFLGNLFGSVDGVLHGSGSEIMGTMFAVFNSAVLALGGIIIMYTLMVSTMNTAHEGQVLGQKWSSIWIPVRSTAGLALLIPKASGYCLMQIFIMWIVLQGVGAADKIWDAALDYLNRGGVIIRGEPMNPASNSAAAGSQAISEGAATILSGQVCMLGIQKALEQQRQTYLEQKQNKSGPCLPERASATMTNFCNTVVPDFLNTVNTISVQQNNPNQQSSFQVSMPDFPATSDYNFLNGICGTIKWNALTDKQMSQVKQVAGTSQTETISMSRAIAVQQMYMSLSTIARIMVNNDPLFNPAPEDNGPKNYSIVATEQYGIPYTTYNQPCDSTVNCMAWGQASGSGAVLFSGTEFHGAISDYNGVMAPTMSLISQAQAGELSNQLRSFIAEAETQGWIMAGSYFFNLVALNGTAAASPATTADTSSGLDNSSFSVDPLTDVVGQATQPAQCKGTYSQLCVWLQANADYMTNLNNLMNGLAFGSTAVQLPSQNSNPKPVHGKQSSTVYGFINNSLVIRTPGQPGIDPGFSFANKIKLDVKPDTLTMPKQSFDCGHVPVLGCFGRFLGNVFINGMFLTLYNVVQNFYAMLLEHALMAIVTWPLQQFVYIFKAGLGILSVPGINPVVALAVMGTAYINFSLDMWIHLLALMSTPFAVLLVPVYIMALPLLIAWSGVMVTVGMITAYYIPLLPYLMFTFGTIAWLMAVIEAMVAGPLVALGVTHPEGHEAFGKGEPAIMILMNVFLRPSMMIIGYISAIALTYVGVWVLNMGFQNAVAFMQPPTDPNAAQEVTLNVIRLNAAAVGGSLPGGGAIEGGYVNWAGIFALFFAVLAYTIAYLTIVQKAFGLINSLPDKVLRWIGGQPETAGAEAEKMGEELKGKVGESGKATTDSIAQTGKAAAGAVAKGVKMAVTGGAEGEGALGGKGSTKG